MNAQRTATLPANWRERLPDPALYYARNVEKLGPQNASGWAMARCPFHKDEHESLSVHLSGDCGGWKCFAGCGQGDVVAFHQRLTGQGFKDSVRCLLGLSV